MINNNQVLLNLRWQLDESLKASIPLDPCSKPTVLLQSLFVTFSIVIDFGFHHHQRSSIIKNKNILRHSLFVTSMDSKVCFQRFDRQGVDFVPTMQPIISLSKYHFIILQPIIFPHKYHFIMIYPGKHYFILLQLI